MKQCPNCGSQFSDEAKFCPVCGKAMNESGACNNASASGEGAQSSAGSGYQPVYAPPVPVYDPYDHTGEFSARDISDNKVFAMAVYLLGVFGIIVALIASHDSPYVAFHVRQGMKFEITEVLLAVITVLLCWTIIVPIAACIAVVILFVLRIIAFFSICKGRAKEPAIIRSLGFLR